MAIRCRRGADVLAAVPLLKNFFFHCRVLLFALLTLAFRNWSGKNSPNVIAGAHGAVLRESTSIADAFGQCTERIPVLVFATILQTRGFVLFSLITFSRVLNGQFIEFPVLPHVSEHRIKRAEHCVDAVEYREANEPHSEICKEFSAH